MNVLNLLISIIQDAKKNCVYPTKPSNYMYEIRISSHIRIRKVHSIEFLMRYIRQTNALCNVYIYISGKTNARTTENKNPASTILRLRLRCCCCCCVIFIIVPRTKGEWPTRNRKMILKKHIHTYTFRAERARALNAFKITLALATLLKKKKKFQKIL